MISVIKSAICTHSYVICSLLGMKCSLLVSVICFGCRSDAAEKELQLRTKKMREKDELKMTVRHYQFVLLRIRFPDGIILQGIKV